MVIELVGLQARALALFSAKQRLLPSTGYSLKLREFRSQVMGKRTCASFHKDLILEESCEDNLYTRCIYYSKACLRLSDFYVLDSASPPPFPLLAQQPILFYISPPSHTHAHTHTRVQNTERSVVGSSLVPEQEFLKWKVK